MRTGELGQVEVLHEWADQKEHTSILVATSPAIHVKTKGKAHRSRRVGVHHQITPVCSLSSEGALINLLVMISHRCELENDSSLTGSQIAEHADVDERQDTCVESRKGKYRQCAQPRSLS